MSQRRRSKVLDTDLISKILPLMNRRVPEDQLILETVRLGAGQEQAQRLVFQLYANGARKLIDRKAPHDEIKTRLSDLGASPQTVKSAIDAAQSLQWDDETKELIKQKISPEEISLRLSAQGANSQVVERAFAIAQTDLVSKEFEKKQRKEKGKSQLVWGLLILGIGLVVTFASYSAASSGGTYIIAAGAIVIGAFKIFQGLVNVL